MAKEKEPWSSWAASLRPQALACDCPVLTFLCWTSIPALSGEMPNTRNDLFRPVIGTHTDSWVPVTCTLPWGEDEILGSSLA